MVPREECPNRFFFRRWLIFCLYLLINVSLDHNFFFRVYRHDVGEHVRYLKHCYRASKKFSTAIWNSFSLLQSDFLLYFGSTGDAKSDNRRAWNLKNRYLRTFGTIGCDLFFVWVQNFFQDEGMVPYRLQNSSVAPWDVLENFFNRSNVRGASGKNTLHDESHVA